MTVPRCAGGTEKRNRVGWGADGEIAADSEGPRSAPFGRRTRRSPSLRPVVRAVQVVRDSRTHALLEGTPVIAGAVGVSKPSTRSPGGR